MINAKSRVTTQITQVGKKHKGYVKVVRDEVLVCQALFENQQEAIAWADQQRVLAEQEN